MTRITLDTDTSDCPGAVCKIVADDGRNILVQYDTDACGVASSFGWSPSCMPAPSRKDRGWMCYHAHTNGTVDCPDCDTKASAFLRDALLFIEEHDGESVDDPGYFDGE